jgi:hypothetical protein
MRLLELPQQAPAFVPGSMQLELTIYTTPFIRADQTLMRKANPV